MSEWLPLVGVLLGGLVGFGSSFGMKALDRRHERLALRAAFRAEIRAILEIAEIRKHDVAARAWIVAWKAGKDFTPTMTGVPREDDPVYRNNVDKIGVLRADAAEVVQFYTLLKAIRVHLIAIEDGWVTHLSPEQKIAFTEEALSLWDLTQAKAKMLIDRLGQ